MEISKMLLTELVNAKRLPYVHPQTIEAFRQFVNTNTGLLRETNTFHHACTFFLPIHIPSRSVFLVHHIKAQDWIPPGGHIDPDETPLETVRREFKEELGYAIKKEPVRLANLTLKHIRTSRHPCRTHYDFWYIVKMKDATPFAIDKKEFYSAAWFPIKQALGKMDLPLYRTAIVDSVLPLFA